MQTRSASSFWREQQGSGIAWPNFDDWRQRATSFDGIASSLADAVIVTGGHSRSGSTREA